MGKYKRPGRPRKSFKKGGIVPATGKYTLHAGEMVVPATMPMSPTADSSLPYGVRLRIAQQRAQAKKR